MRLASRGWHRNHGWRELFKLTLKNASIQDAEDSIVPYEGVVLNTSELRPDRVDRGHIEVLFRSEIKNPSLGGEYMLSMKFSKLEVLRLYNATFGEVAHQDILKGQAMLGEIEPVDR